MKSRRAREQQALDDIKDTLAGSDPKLAALLAGFSRLASGEEMPARERIQADGWRRIRRARRHPRRDGRCRYAGRVYQRLGFQRAGLLLWLLISTVLVTVGASLSGAGSGQGACAGSWVAVSAPAHIACGGGAARAGPPVPIRRPDRGTARRG